MEPETPKNHAKEAVKATTKLNNMAKAEAKARRALELRWAARRSEYLCTLATGTLNVLVHTGDVSEDEVKLLCEAKQ